mmetsp:Transcript_20161/g.44007  ORF Transcript_20161/g.44007 Transcript_20161/m.44007 type:complete len:102 (-) Transcript_20161:379-684(-)
MVLLQSLQPFGRNGVTSFPSDSAAHPPLASNSNEHLSQKLAVELLGGAGKVVPAGCAGIAVIATCGAKVAGGKVVTAAIIEVVPGAIIVVAAGGPVERFRQ